jgi:hypothetical protein
MSGWRVDDPINPAPRGEWVKVLVSPDQWPMARLVGTDPQRWEDVNGREILNVKWWSRLQVSDDRPPSD